MNGIAAAASVFDKNSQRIAAHSYIAHTVEIRIVFMVNGRRRMYAGNPAEILDRSDNRIMEHLSPARCGSYQVYSIGPDAVRWADRPNPAIVYANRLPVGVTVDGGLAEYESPVLCISSRREFTRSVGVFVDLVGNCVFTLCGRPVAAGCAAIVSGVRIIAAGGTAFSFSVSTLV